MSIGAIHDQNTVLGGLIHLINCEGAIIILGINSGCHHKDTRDDEYK